jgi:phospholipid/cholesterol/gamma-HCH transport system substrate-binding protein
MHKYRGQKLVKPGFIALVLIVLIIAVGLQPERLTSWARDIRYEAVFTEAAGLSAGNDVMVAGIKVGTVSDMWLQKGKVWVRFAIDRQVRLGSETTAHIKTGSLLGQRILTLQSAGRDRLHSNGVIPVNRTFSPYSLTDAVADLTTNLAGTDTDTLNRSLSTLADTVDQISPELGSTFDGVTRLSQAMNSRSETLADLLKSAAKVTGVLADRSGQINTLILDGNDLLGVLVERRNAIADLLANVTAVSRHLSGVISDNESKLAPTLDRLNSVAAMLQNNLDNISKALPGLKNFMLKSGEIVATGPYYTAYVPNLVPPQFIQPFLDYAFGFRAGDPNMPRALIPLPSNGVPGGSR